MQNKVAEKTSGSISNLKGSNKYKAGSWFDVNYKSIYACGCCVSEDPMLWPHIISQPCPFSILHSILYLCLIFSGRERERGRKEEPFANLEVSKSWFVVPAQCWFLINNATWSAWLIIIYELYKYTNQIKTCLDKLVFLRSQCKCISIATVISIASQQCQLCSTICPESSTMCFSRLWHLLFPPESVEFNIPLLCSSFGLKCCFGLKSPKYRKQSL